MREMGSMLKQVLTEMKKTEKSHQPEPEELSITESEGSDFIKVCSRRKKRSKRVHRKRYSCSSSATSGTSTAFEEEEGKTKKYAPKRFLSEGVNAKSAEDVAWSYI